VAPGAHRIRETGAKVAALCRQAGVPAEHVALRFCLGHLSAATTLPGMSRVSSVEKNVRVLDANIPAELLEDIESVVRPVLNFRMAVGQTGESR
jgi:L-galactose dehydrogenase